MQFGTLFAAFLATLAIASPVPPTNQDAAPAIVEGYAPVPVATTSLEARMPPKKAKQEKVNKDETLKHLEEKITAGKELKAGYYAFSMIWARGELRKQSTDPVLEKARDHLGFDHKAVMVGWVKERVSKDTATLKVTDRFFEGYMYDIGLSEDKKSIVPDKIPYRKSSGDGTSSTSGRQIHLVKEINEAKYNGMGAAGNAYATAHKAYDPLNNNCATYADALLGQL